MDALTIAFVTASTALVSAVIGPFVSYVIARRQIRASVISTNRERWTEALRDSVAEYVALLVSASLVKQKIGRDPLLAISTDHELLKVVHRIILVKNKIMLMLNPSEERYGQLCELIEATYQVLASDDPQAVAKIHSGAEAITRTGRDVLRAEWTRVKRGD